MLDISIKQLRSKYKTEVQILQFLTGPSTTEHKTDGVKLTLIKVNNNGNLDDWMVSYKGNIFYRGEFNYQDSKANSLGNSQFDVVFDHLESLGNTPDIEINTEFFIEFLVNKTTVMSNYHNTGQMILIGYGFANPEVRYGKVKTNSTNLMRDRERFANILKIGTPTLLHQGAWYPAESLIANCIHEDLRKSFNEIKDKLTELHQDPLAYYGLVVKQFLDLESQFGGREEGIVIETADGIFKVQQDYQLDKEARYNKKALYMEDDPVKEQEYWDDVLEVARFISDRIDTQNIQEGLIKIAEEITKLNVANTHSKKNEATIKDDIQANAKNFYLKSLKGNNGALVIGKFRVLTKGHEKMILKAMEECDEVVIGIVTGSRTKNTSDIRLRMVRKAFPNLKVIELVSGNLFTAFKKAEININRVYAGSDRREDYERMLLKAPGISVREITRAESDISATKVIYNLDDLEYFKNNTPEAIHDFYKELKDYYEQRE